MPVELRIAESAKDAVLCYQAFVAMHREGCVPGPLVAEKTLANVLRMVRGPGSIILMAMDGQKIGGVLALYEDGYWWNNERQLSDKGFYVLPDYRSGEAFDLLLEAALNASNDTGLPVYITIMNGQRKRGGKTPWERRGLTLGYHPQGAVLAHIPGE